MFWCRAQHLRIVAAGAASLGYLLAAPPAGATVPTCPAPPTSAAQLAAPEADMLGRIEPATFEHSATGAGLRRLAQLDLQLGDWLELLDTCSPSASVVSVAADEHADAVWLIQGPDVSSPQALACLSDWHARRSRGAPPFAGVPTQRAGGCVGVHAHSDGALTLTAGRDTLVLTTAGWAQHVTLAMSEPSARGQALDLLDGIARLGVSDGNLFVGTLHRPDTLIDTGPWELSVRNFAVVIDIDAVGRLGVKARIETRDFGESVLGALREGLANWTQRARTLGLPAGLLDTVSLETRGVLVDVNWVASPSKLSEIGAALSRNGRGGSLF